MGNAIKTIVGVAVPIVVSTVWGYMTKTSEDKKMRDTVAEEVKKQLSEAK